MTRHRDRLDFLAIALMTTLCITWGFNQVVIKTANAGISPLLQASFRSAGAALLLWAWSASRGVKLFERDGTFAAGIWAGLLFAGEFALIYWGLEFTTASRTSIFIYTSPFVVAIGCHWLVPGEKLRPIQIAGLIGAFAGVALAFSDGLGLPTNRQLIGDAMIIGAAVFWGATTVLVKASPLAKVSPNKTLFYQLAVSAVTLLPASWLLGERGVFNPTPLVFGALAIQTVLIAFITYLAWFWLIRHYPAGRLASFTFLTPLFGVLAGAILLSEPITPLLVLALLLVGAGIYLVNRPAPLAAPAAALKASSAD
jgi:drug/metabolite transporter (DMT)-like permease